MPEQKVLAKGLIERIGISDGRIEHNCFKEGQWQKRELNVFIRDHRIGLEKLNELLLDTDVGVIKNYEEIEAVGHRVVHGGETLTTTTLIDEDVKQKIKSLFKLAPLHNPSNYIGIEVAEELFPKARQVAVFDTAFHCNLPEKAYRYALPDEFYESHHVRVYGFHGISHHYVTHQSMKYLNDSQAKLVSLHLGNGASAAAVEEGISVETSMGFGPNSGLIMGTRSGDLDSTIVLYTLQAGYGYEDLYEIFNKNSGMLGISGYSDMRDIGRAYQERNPKARLAYTMYAHRIKKYIGSFSAVMNGLDALIFTGGVGENDALVRKLVCTDLDFFGIVLDEEKNLLRAPGIREIQKDGERVKILIIPTDEEWQIALEVFHVL